MRSETGVSILVVENDPELRRLITLRLTSAGHQCTEAGTGAQALGEWRHRSFDVVVSDLNMPSGDGIALADALQRDEVVPIIFITGFRDDYKRRLRKVKDATVLEKPFDLAQLLELIEAALLGRETGDDGLRHPHGADGK